MTDLERITEEFLDTYRDLTGYRPKSVTFQTICEARLAIEELLDWGARLALDN